ncbi:MAG: carbohydrate esterase family 16 protein [Lentinula lateritia]|uniref:Carbohydrate esterase family 16 protein n=1 Tax=Lentinula lateritia TaxID=40482 RepID=A0ABQ8VDL1_9AGAR|nr:MAG: carbohydrate esterase family 16 protein [Lentinula lateritia]KAJ4489211.1 carbohydrate esterase family 16 protein [Lentinula lateritia]
MICFAITLIVITHLWASATAAVSRRQSTTDVHLAVSPNCGSLSGPPADVNNGLKPLTSYNTIVAFGDSYTSGSTFNGSALVQPVLSPPNPNAGGRITNGALWVENLAAAANASLQDWAVNGSVVDHNMYLDIDFTGIPDYMTQVQNYIGVRPSSVVDDTLYVIFMGMGLTTIASDIIYSILELSSNPVFAKNFLIVDNYGRGTESEAGDAYKTSLFTQLYEISNDLDYDFSFAFVDFKTLWDGVLNGSPGYEAFGYTNAGACLSNDISMTGECDDPEHTFYWIPGNPSAVTHSIMAEYVQEVLTQCGA